MSSPFLITGHAVEQFVSRYDRRMSQDDAKALLQTTLDGGNVFLANEKTLTGEYLWHLPSLGLALVTKPRKEGHIIVTVLPENKIKAVQEGLNQAHMEAALELYHRAVPPPMEDLTGKPQTVRFVLEVAFVANFPNRLFAVNRVKERILQLFNGGSNVTFKKGTIKSISLRELPEGSKDGY